MFIQVGSKLLRRPKKHGTSPVSPLLANVYINRLWRHWKKTGAAERLGAVVSYADDFVILCRSRLQAHQSLEQISRWLAKLGLTIHPDKTRLCFAWEESFDFLGYTFGPARHWRTGRRCILVQPSKKAQKRLKEKIDTLLYRGNPTPWPLLRDQLNRLLVGWARYFSIGHPSKARSAIGWHVVERVHRFLCKRHKLRPHGTGRFGATEIYGPAGVVNVQYQPRGRTAHACS